MGINSSFLSKASGLAAGVTNAVSRIGSNIGASATRLLTAGLPKGAEAIGLKTRSTAGFSTAEIDWRVKLSLPTNLTSIRFSNLMQPLNPTTGTNGLVFPFTPTISITHTANYNALDTVHSNYQFLSYEHSKVETINISGDFYCEDSNDAKYWVAAVHYLRTVTKMHYGETTDAGAPPPVVKLTGYGDYVFNNIPVVVTSFNIEMPKDVDYIPASISGSGNQEGAARVDKVNYAPVRSTINVEVRPIYSREQVRKFSLDSFARGDYVFDQQNKTGYI